jgi:hypothetical protein
VVKYLIPTVLGLIAGVTGAYWTPLLTAKTMQPTEARSERAAVHRGEPREVVTVTRSVAAPSTPLEAKVAASTVLSPSRRDVPELTPEQSTERVHQQFQSELEQHARDARDAAWAPNAETKLSASLKGVSSEGQLERVECKTTSCVATFTWPDNETAQRGYRQLLLAEYKPNCGVSTVLPDAAGAGGRYQSQMIFDCVSARANN